MSSEVAALKERLRLEAEAMFQGLYGYAEVAKHQIIEQKMQYFGEIGEQLKQYIGAEEATQFVINTLDQAERKGCKGETNAALLIRDGRALSTAGDQGVDVALPPMHHIPAVG